MAYMAAEGEDTGLASFAHLSAIVGPLIPLAIWAARRNDDPFVTREAAKAANFSAATALAFIAATLVAVYVPFVGFVGTLAQLVILVVAIFLCIQAFRAVRRLAPTSYPFQLRMVRDND